MKFDLRRKTQLVAVSNTKVERDEDHYCGLANIDTVRTDFFLGQINYLEVDTADVGNNYIHGFTKEKIYAVAGHDFGEWEGQILICVRLIFGLNKYMAR